MYAHEERYEVRFISLKTGKETRRYPRSSAQKDEFVSRLKNRGIRVLSIKKLYPFSTMRNQHNFELIRNICFNRMHDMNMGDARMDEAEYSRLEDLKEKAETFFCLELPVAWLPWEEYRNAKELAQMAILHRQNACIENGRPDLVAYC